MEFSELLKPFACSCGRTHSCDIRQIVICPGALEALPEPTRDCGSILLAADQNTWPTSGPAVEALRGGKKTDAVIFASEGFLVPDEAAIAALQAKVTEQTDLILGIGSGVIQDLCKYVSFRSGLP